MRNPLPILLLLLLTTQTESADTDTPHTPMSKPTAQEEWKQKTLSYAQAINAFVQQGLTKGWKNAGKEPEAPGIDHLAREVIAQLRRANKEGPASVQQFREQWPPAHAPLIPLLEENSQSIPIVCLMDDGSILARIGVSYWPGRTFHIRGDQATELPITGFFGRCPNRRYFGIVQDTGIAILDGWQGPQVALCPWPKGTEDLPAGFKVTPWSRLPTISRIIPFPDGKRVLMVSAQGIYVLSETSAQLLHPTKDQLQGHFEDQLEDDPKSELSIEIAMEHAAISRDGRFIAVGSQDSTHLIYNDKLELIGDIGNRSSYPHHAAFSADQSMIAFNSCHFHQGITVGVPTRLLPDLQTDNFEEDVAPTLEDNARVYAAVSRNDEFIIGDASGYIRAFDLKGNRRWQQFIGSTVGDIDISPDGKTLVVSTYAGFISIFHLDAGHSAPHQIGNGPNLETRRWIFWKNEPAPLIW